MFIGVCRVTRGSGPSGADVPQWGPSGGLSDMRMPEAAIDH